MISTQKLYDLVHSSQQFISSVINLNNLAFQHLHHDQPKDALLSILDAQRILQYAASCGKNFDRKLILTVLQNEACCYQKVWQLQKCCNYLEALIYNINEQIQSVQTSSRSENFIQNNKSKSLIFQIQLNQLKGKSITQRVRLCKYELQYCAINSQLRNHRISLIIGKKVISILKKIFQELRMGGQKKKVFSEEQKASLSDKIKTIRGINSMSDIFECGKVDEYIITAKYYFWKWNIRKLQQKNENLKQKLKTFSIGIIMKINPKFYDEKEQTTIDDFQVSELKQETYLNVIYKILLLSAAYFTIATELRLIAGEKHKKNLEAKVKSQEYIQSQIYHLLSLIIVCVYVPFDMVYVRHILSSFTNHYNIDLSSDGNCFVNSSKVMKNIFDKEMLVERKVRSYEKNKSLKYSFKLSSQKHHKLKNKKSHEKQKGSKKRDKKNSIKKHRKVNSEVNQRLSGSSKVKVSLKNWESKSGSKERKGKSKTMKNSRWEDELQFSDRFQNQYFYNSPAIIQDKLSKVIKEKQRHMVGWMKSSEKSTEKKKRVKGKKEEKGRKENYGKNLDKYYF